MAENYHIPVLLNESIEGLNIADNGIYIDATFGGGGHSRAIVSKLKTGHLFGFDQDSDAKTNTIDSENFTFVYHNFAYVKNFMQYYNIPAVDGILADLGVSSHHFDDAQRGFSFRFDAPLDMRMDRSVKKSAYNIINEYDEQELTKIFKMYGEIANARRLAQEIISNRTAAPIKTTDELKKIGQKFCNPQTESKYLSQIFQALRIEVNNEMQALQEFLQGGLSVLKPGGRFVVITYHSLEDRMVKNFFKTGNIEGDVDQDFFGNVKAPFTAVSKKVIVPSNEEIQRNNRARSAKLRIVEKNG
ncbi:MAG: 16S rRNA (cytosine(1402)-N(4))-methyltransferase RsmH [Bacteroidales bacterium]|nr:16S rRNA (cytosine(1402)-N(4))-methyltransferase RsmH [Bacteroidales bacterium]